MNGNDVIEYLEKHYDTIIDIAKDEHPKMSEEEIMDDDEILEEIAERLMVEG